MFDLELYTSSVTNGSLLQVTSKYNSVVPTLNSGFQVPTLNKIMAAFAISAHAQRLQLQAPSMRSFPYPDYVPVNRGTVFESPVRGFVAPQYPVPLNYTEELDAFAENNNSAAETMYAAVIFCDGPVAPAPAGRAFTVHGTSSTTLTAGAFTSFAPVLDQSLPAGQYALIGARAYSATALFFRIIPAMGPLWRPGSVAVQAYDGMGADGARMGGWGTWLVFQQNVAPSVEIFATSADTAEEVWLDLVYMGPGASPQAS